ncbi:MAG: NUDIX domain-containing protein [Gelidibacter sp.]
MTTIFVNDKPIILTTEVGFETNFKNYLLDTVHIGKVIKELNSTDLEGVRLIGKNEHSLLKKFLKKLPNIVAGGGKVLNKNGDILFIYRNDKWDLPKGKVEGKESIEETSLREVEEETNVTGLKIIKQLDTTYHIFKRNGRHKIKITYWFEMSSNYNGKLEPQVEEGITKVEWLNPQETLEAMENSYANIRILV